MTFETTILIIVCKNGRHDIGTLIFYNDCVYMFGGTSSTSSKIEFLFPFRNLSFTTSQDSQSLQNNRGAMSSVVLQNGLIYLIAGLAGGRVNRASSFLVLQAIYLELYSMLASNSVMT